MKKFVLTFLIFTIGLEVLVRTTTVPWIFEPSFSQIGSLRSVEKEIVEANSTKIVFLGNSLTRDAVSPLIVSDSLNLNKKEVLNLGLSAGNYFIDEYLIKSFNVKPEIIFLQVDIGRFEYDQIEDTYYFIKYSKLNDWNTISKYWYSPDNFLTSMSKLYASRDIWHRFVFFRNESENIGEIIKKDQLGQFEVYKNNETLNEGNFDLQKYKNYKETIDGSNSLIYLKKICKFSQENNINLNFIHMPIKIDSDSTEADIVNDFLLYIEKQCSGVQGVYNFANFNFENNNIFLDYGHLNNIGAEEFSKNLMISYEK